jgi:riboflavin kinase / FMN adenylyltransferase
MSTQHIRQLVEAGDLAAAARLLGRPFEVEGLVVEGDRRGRLLGFPTANLRLAPGLVLPPNGIYAGAAHGHRAAVSIGVRPHYGGAERMFEAYLLDFDGDLYGEMLRVELWSFLRPEAAFASEADLVRQIALDVEAARAAARPV